MVRYLISMSMKQNPIPEANFFYFVYLRVLFYLSELSLLLLTDKFSLCSTWLLVINNASSLRANCSLVCSTAQFYIYTHAHKLQKHLPLYTLSHISSTYIPFTIQRAFPVLKSQAPAQRHPSYITTSFTGVHEHSFATVGMFYDKTATVYAGTASCKIP